MFVLRLHTNVLAAWLAAGRGHFARRPLTSPLASFGADVQNARMVADKLPPLAAISAADVAAIIHNR